MTKKDYELIAKCFRVTRPANEQLDNPYFAEWNTILNQIAFELRLDNPRFDENKFFKACYE